MTPSQFRQAAAAVLLIPTSLRRSFGQERQELPAARRRFGNGTQGSAYEEHERLARASARTGQQAARCNVCGATCTQFSLLAARRNPPPYRFETEGRRVPAVVADWNAELAVT